VTPSFRTEVFILGGQSYRRKHK